MTGSEVSSDAPRDLRLDLPAAHSAVRMARHLVREFASEYVAEGEIETLELVTSELLSNAVDHGGGNSAMEESDLDAPVRMLLALEVSVVSWKLEVSDEGGGDPIEVEALMHPDGLPDLEDERGRGFFLLSSMVDTMSVRRTENGRGLVLSAEKRHALG